jgi:hypothetical protein
MRPGVSLSAACALAALLAWVHAASAEERAATPAARERSDAGTETDSDRGGGTSEPRAWDIGGVRLEADQVERLADDMARSTVLAVEARIADIALADAQRAAMLDIYRRVALRVYGQIVGELSRGELLGEVREARLRELALEGQRESHALLLSVLDARQMALYTPWEDAQVAAFKSQRWQDRRGRRRR